MVALRAHAAAGDPAARILTRRVTADPYPLYELARDRGAVSRSSLGPLYVMAGHNAVEWALRDPKLGVIRGNRFRISETVQPLEDSFIRLDPPEHTRQRRLVLPWFSARALQQRREHIVATVDDCLDELADRDGFDLVADFALPVAIRVICEVIGLPRGEERRLAGWGAMLSLSLDRVRTLRQRRLMQESLVDMDRYFGEVVAGDRVPEGSVLDALRAAAGDPERLTRRDVVATASFLLLAGFETVVSLIGSASLRLLDDAELRQRALDDPDAMARIIEETLRHEPPVGYTFRRVKEPCEIEGMELPPFSQVLVLLAGACRDPQVFDEPHRFLPDRPNSRDHLAFASGVHYCIGAGLARVEAEAALTTLLHRMPDLRRAGTPAWNPVRNLRGLRSLPVQRTRTPQRADTGYDERTGGRA